jgi:hypothetical protein
MARNSFFLSGLAGVAILTGFWAYTVMDMLIRNFGIDMTWIDLGPIFMLGLIPGGAPGLAAALR